MTMKRITYSKDCAFNSWSSDTMILAHAFIPWTSSIETKNSTTKRISFESQYFHRWIGIVEWRSQVHSVSFRSSRFQTLRFRIGDLLGHAKERKTYIPSDEDLTVEVIVHVKFQVQIVADSFRPFHEHKNSRIPWRADNN
jgi:hypothetical protein